MAAAGIPRGQVEGQHLPPTGVGRWKWPIAKSRAISVATFSGQRFVSVSCKKIIFFLDVKDYDWLSNHSLLGIFLVLFLGQAWWCSRLIPDSVFRNYSFCGPRDYMVCQGSNPGLLCARQMPYCDASLRPLITWNLFIYLFFFVCVCMCAHACACAWSQGSFPAGDPCVVLRIQPGLATLHKMCLNPCIISLAPSSYFFFF